MLTTNELNEAAVLGLELADERHDTVWCKGVTVMACFDGSEIRVSDDWLTVDGADYFARFLAAWVLRMRERQASTGQTLFEGGGDA